jgi:5-methylcytosine-specific restriction protein A
MAVRGMTASRFDDSWRKDKSSTQRGYGYKWQQSRKIFLAQHPLCERCKAEGKVTVAEVVDHIIPHKGDMKLFWDTKNWSALCKWHHDSVKQREENGKEIRAVGLDGVPEGW